MIGIIAEYDLFTFFDKLARVQFAQYLQVQELVHCPTEQILSKQTGFPSPT
jgi:hypothetical protein